MYAAIVCHLLAVLLPGDPRRRRFTRRPKAEHCVISEVASSAWLRLAMHVRRGARETIAFSAMCCSLCCALPFRVACASLAGAISLDIRDFLLQTCWRVVGLPPLYYMMLSSVESFDVPCVA